MSQRLGLDLHPFLIPLEKIRHESGKTLLNSARRKRFGIPQSPFILAVCTSHFISSHQLWTCGRADFVSLWPNNNGLVASLTLSQNLGENNAAFWGCQVAARSLPACLTPEPSSDGYSNSSFGDGQLAGAWRHMVTSFLPKKPSPRAKNLASQCWLSGLSSQGTISEHPLALLFAWSPAALSGLPGITVSGTQKRELDRSIGET